MCRIIGISQQVAIGVWGGEGRGGERGETWDISEMVRRPDGVIEMMSGSCREGFRLKGSDVDFMC